MPVHFQFPNGFSQAPRTMDAFLSTSKFFQFPNGFSLAMYLAREWIDQKRTFNSLTDSHLTLTVGTQRPLSILFQFPNGFSLKVVNVKTIKVRA